MVSRSLTVDKPKESCRRRACDHRLAGAVALGVVLTVKAVGKLKQGVGKITGSKQTQAKGAAQEVKGKGQQTMGRPNPP